MKKVILIKPTTSWLKKEQGRAIPLGLIFSAVHLVNKYEVIILDEHICKDIYKELPKYFNSETIAFGFSVFSGPQIKYALNICKFIKQNSTIPIIWGGIHPSLLPEQTLQNRNIDYVVRGEGEETLFELINVLHDKKLNMLSTVAGIAYKDSTGNILMTPDRAFINLDTVPLWPLKLVDMKNYIVNNHFKKYVHFQLSRGCVKGCNYCYNKVYNKGTFRYPSIATTIRQLDQLITLAKPQGIFFIDDNIFLDKKYLLQLVEYLWSKGIYSAYQGGDVRSLNRFSQQEFEFLYTHGVERIHLGLESGSPRIRALINKEGSIDEIVNLVDKMKTTKIQIWCNCMINLPTETISDFKETIALLFRMRKINKSVVSTALFKYLPGCGTKLFNDLQGKYKAPASLEEWGELYWEAKNSPIFAEYLQDEWFYKGIYISNLLFDEKIEGSRLNVYSIILSYFAKLYRPIASYRLKNLDFRLGLDVWLIDKLFNIFVAQ